MRLTFLLLAAAHAATLVERQLISESPSIDDILQEHDKAETDDIRAFAAPTLAYVTPWNSRGYDVALRFATKWTMISPVWFTLKLLSGQPSLESAKNDTFATQLRKTSVKLLPRVRLELSQQPSPDALPAIINAIVDLGSEYDGIVLEPGFYHPEFISAIGQNLHASNRMLVLVLPATPQRVQFENVDYYSVMTYDHGYGPIAPLSWVESIMSAMCAGDCDKFLLGLNFYGYDSHKGRGDAVTGTAFLDLLREFKPTIQFDSNAEEHFIVYSRGQERHRVFYPSLLSIDRRIQLAEDMNAGLAIWEIGQGLDYFIDLL